VSVDSHEALLGKSLVITEEIQSANYFNVGLGYTLFSYSYETSRSSFSHSGSSLTLKAGLLYPISAPYWDLGLSAYYTLLPITKSSEFTYTFFGVNARVGYLLTDPTNSLRVSIMGGIYYLNAARSDGNKGYSNVGGPQIYPTLRKTFLNKTSAYIYGKFSPVSSDITKLSVGSREIAFGGGYSRPFKFGASSQSKYSLSFTFDFANLVLVIPVSGLDVTIKTNTYTLGSSLSF
jgi:hypothetical protein